MRDGKSGLGISSENGYKKDRQKKISEFREGDSDHRCHCDEPCSFEGILSWKLTMDVGVWLVLLIRFAGYRKKKKYPEKI